jgi:hypothetical protein
MEIDIKVKNIDMYGISEIDNSEFKSTKYLTKDDISFKIASMHGVSVDEIKFDFSKELDKAYETNTNNFIKKEIVDDLKFRLGHLLNNDYNKFSDTDINPLYRRLDVDFKNKVIIKKLNYEETVQWYVKERGLKWANWLNNYINGKSDTKGNPFKFGDKEKVTYLEKRMLKLGNVNLNISYNNEIYKWKLNFKTTDGFQIWKR